jgi:hypothetical protein
MKKTLALIATIALATACNNNLDTSVDKDELLTDAVSNFFAELPETLVTVNGQSHQIQVTENDVDSFIATNKERLTNTETGEALPRETVTKIVRKQKHDAALAAFIEELRQKADITMAPAFKQPVTPTR